MSIRQNDFINKLKADSFAAKPHEGEEEYQMMRGVSRVMPNLYKGRYIGNYKVVKDGLCVIPSQFSRVIFTSVITLIPSLFQLLYVNQ